MNKMTTPIVTIKEGQLKGKIAQDFLGGSYFSFLGIPYGKAPLGELRFKAPLPVEPWNGIRDATKEGPECPSLHMLFVNFVGSEENCLNLNVYTRQLSKGGNDSLKPVMVWIHGGAFMLGSNKSDFYGPDYLITENIVLVSINYRTGVLGFLSLKDPSLEVPGNAGMKDMVLALQWIQRNIRNFGGDPNNVTIFGESAGSAAVQYLCLSPLSKGLFHKGICQSGSCLNAWAKGCSNGLEIAKDLGYKETDEKMILEYLKNISPRQIVKAQHKTLLPFNASTVRRFGPVVEQYLTETSFLTEEPLDIIKSGRFIQVPLIMGYNSHEGMIQDLFDLRQSRSKTNFENEIDYSLKPDMSLSKSVEIATSIKKFYFGKEEPSDKTRENFHLLRSDTMFVHGIHRSISYQKQTTKSPIYMYRMSVDTSLNQFKRIATSKNIYILVFLYILAVKIGYGILKNFFLSLANLIPNRFQPGVCHADDLSYLFKSYIASALKPWSIEEISVKRFVKLWTNFARTGNPTPDKNDPLLGVEWKPVTKEDNYYLDIGTELKVKANPDSERMEFWDKIYG